LVPLLSPLACPADFHLLSLLAGSEHQTRAAEEPIDDVGLLLDTVIPGSGVKMRI
jgi:hypothetical protein